MRRTSKKKSLSQHEQKIERVKKIFESIAEQIEDDRIDKRDLTTLRKFELAFSSYVQIVRLAKTENVDDLLEESEIELDDLMFKISDEIVISKGIK